jgi:hypothetical protein
MRSREEPRRNHLDLGRNPSSALYDMLRIPPENHEQAARILEVVRRERRGGPDDADSRARLSEAIHKAWELCGTDDLRERGPKSAALRKAASIEGVIDHPVPQSHLTKMLLSMPKEDYRIPYISNLLHKFAFFSLFPGLSKTACISSVELPNFPHLSDL